MTRRNPRDEGSVLIITFIFLIMVSLVVVTLSSWTANGLNNTQTFQTATSQYYAGGAATQVAMRAARYTYPVANSQICPGTPQPLFIKPNNYVQVWCTTLSIGTRLTTLTACLMPNGTTLLNGVCTILKNGSTVPVPTLLVAVVDFNDYTPNQNPNNLNCTVGNQSTCGAAMTIYSWKSF